MLLRSSHDRPVIGRHFAGAGQSFLHGARNTERPQLHASVGCEPAAWMDTLHRAFARRVKTLMRGKGLSINRLADFTGIGRGGLSEILSAKSSPTLRTIGKIAEGLDVSARDLLPADEGKPGATSKSA